jgi:formylglycine-generating enzyme required for sulfatase activity
LAGNVSEWVDGGQIESGTIWKHIRGASWRKAGQRYGLTFFFRQELVDPAMCQDDLGFRCVIDLPGRPIPQQAFVPLGRDQFADAEGQRQFIGGFLMARFAVTNQEYAEFRANHAFDPRLASHPVTGVSHQDALDFCRWKTQREGKTFGLPARAEWERAYRGTEGRRYPWGSEYSKYRCNSLESGWGRTISVWDLWQGATPEGIYNLCGNTFEWTREGQALGGSWCSTCDIFGAEPYQAASVDLEGREDIGFRCVTY